ncbi:alcohol acetyltransferase [Morchella snyderi]|nr:alcohol acetyltransferase [Morchella snyderi]
MTENIAQTLRPVGMLEKYSTVRHNLSFYINVAVTARYTSSSPNPLSKATIYRALTTLITTHAPLGTTILGENTPHPTFARLARINLDELVAITHLRAATTDPAAELAEIDEILSSQHNNKFRELGRLPLWRVIIIAPRTPDPAARGVDVAFVYHHALGDGVTGLAFHHALLRALNTPCEAAEEEGPSVVVPPELPLAPPVEGLVSLSTSVSKLWSQVWPPKTAHAGHWSGAAIQIPLKNVVRTVVFPAGVLAGVVAACRREGTTVTALLEAVLARAFFGVLGEETEKLSTTTAIDLRRFIRDAGDETMGVMVCSVPVVHERRAAADVWGVARRCKAIIQKALEAGTKDTDTGLLKYLSNYEKYFLGKLGTRREHSLGVSNLGAFKSTSVGEWGISRVIFSQSASVSGCAVEFSVASVVGGEMCVCVCVQEGIVEEEVLASVVKAFEAALVELAG